MRSKADRLVLMVIAAIFGFAGALWLFDPSGELLKTILAYSLFAGVGLLGLVVLYGLFFLVKVIWANIMYGIRDRGKDEPSDFYDR
jgi:multidrug transporter EmrE-like cation transporter